MNLKYVQMARNHWTKHLPKKVAELKAEGMLQDALQTAAIQATDRVVELMQLGYRHHEAEEVARAEFLILPPEETEWEDSDLEDDEAQDSQY